MPFKAIYTAAGVKSQRPSRTLLARLGAVAALALAYGNAEATQYSCTFINPNRTQYIQTPTQIVILPGTGSSGTKFTITDPGVSPTGTVNCDTGAKLEPTEGLRRNIDIFIYFDEPYYRWENNKTIRLGDSDFGLRVNTASKSFQSNPLRMRWGTIGYINDTLVIHYGNGGPIEFELVHLGTGSVDGTMVKLSETGLFGRAMVAIKGVDPFGRDLVSNELVTLLWKTNEIPVSQTTCNIQNKTVSLGTHHFGAGTIGATSPPQEFSISMTNCPTGVPTYYRIDPATEVLPGPVGSSGSSLMKLDGTGAAGVGIQLLSQNGDPLPLETKLTITATGLSSPNYDLWLKARYYQFSNSITPGTANASATITVSHQ